MPRRHKNEISNGLPRASRFLFSHFCSVRKQNVKMNNIHKYSRKNTEKRGHKAGNIHKRMNKRLLIFEKTTILCIKCTKNEYKNG